MKSWYYVYSNCYKWFNRYALYRRDMWLKKVIKRNNMIDLKFGIVQAGVRHASHEEPNNVQAMFALVKEKEVFDHIVFSFGAIDVVPATGVMACF